MVERYMGRVYGWMFNITVLSNEKLIIHIHKYDHDDNMKKVCKMFGLVYETQKYLVSEYVDWMIMITKIHFLSFQLDSKTVSQLHV